MPPSQQDSDPFAIGDPSYRTIARAIKQFDPLVTISSLAGLLTVPEYHPQTIRIEILLHLAVLHADGPKTPRNKHFSKWLEGDLGNHVIKSMEDPPEDVFVSNVIGPGGNFRIFEGVWEVNDYYLQHLLDCLALSPFRSKVPHLLPSILALLKVSDEVAKRSGLRRWEPSPMEIPTKRFLKNPNLSALSRRVAFRISEFEKLGFDPLLLRPFLFIPAERSQLVNERWGHSSLERYPIVWFDDVLVLTCPSAVSPAIRRYVLDDLAGTGLLEEFGSYLRTRQRNTFSEAVKHLIGRNRAFDGEIPQAPGPTHPVHAIFDTGAVAFDVDKLAHMVLLHDDLEAVRSEGLTSQMLLSAEDPAGFEQYLRETATHYAGHVSSGLTVVIRSGIGRGVGVILSRLHANWHLVVLDLPDFEMLAWSKEMTLLKLWKLEEQLDVIEKEGVEIIAISGPLNRWAYWQDQDCQLLPPSIPVPSQRIRGVNYGTNYICGYRLRERYRRDVHAASFGGGRYHVTVERLVPDSYFMGRHARPVYASPGHAKRGELAGIVEGRLLAVWVRGTRPEAPQEVTSFLYQLWDAVLQWLDRIVVALENYVEREVIVEVVLQFVDIERWNEFSSTAGTVPPEDVRLEVHDESRTIDLRIPFGFTNVIARPHNDAERALVNLLCSGLCELLAFNRVSRPFTWETIASAIVRNVDARALHLYATPTPTDYIHAGDTPHPRFVQPEDQAAHQLGLGWQALGREEADDKPLDLTTAEHCTAALNKIVQLLWERTRDQLQSLDGPALVYHALENNEEILRDRTWWRRSASALIGLFGDEEDVIHVAGRREFDRGLALQSTRILIEMAVSTCKRTGGRAITVALFDRLLAGVALLLHAAADSDAIHGRLATPHVRVYPNGTIVSDAEFTSAVAATYSVETFGGVFRSAARTYSQLYHAKEPEAPASSQFETDERLIHAFSTEYGIHPTRLFEALAEFWDVGNEVGQSVVVTTRAVVAERLQMNRGFSDEESLALLHMLSLTPRPRWDKAPPGFLTRDWIPWHFRRRLSVVARPLITFGDSPEDTLVYGMEQVGLSISYLLDGVRLGWLPNEFFSSSEMHRYRGHVADKLGHAFNEEVATRLQSLGWRTRTEIQMTEFSAPQEFGDLDVVAWCSSDTRLLLIECKRLQPIRNMGEIVERLNQFKGEAGDRLGRHLRRTRWTEENFVNVRRVLRVADHVRTPVPLLVTNDEVPMRFMRDLPLPPEQIIPVEALESWLTVTAEPVRSV